MLIHNTIPVTLYNNLLTFRDTGKELELKGDLLKMITNKNYNVDLAILSDEKLLYEFAKEMYFDVNAPGNESIRDGTLRKLLKSPGLIVSASGISNTMFLPCDLDELCDRLKLLLQGKQAGNNTDIINEEIIAIIDKLSKYRCISTKQLKQILIQCNLLHQLVYIYPSNCIYTQI